MGRPSPSAPEVPLNAFEQRVRDVVRAIPPGQVSSYSQVAARAGRANGARMVSRAMSKVHGLPWWRVIQSGGTLAPAIAKEQAKRLRAEGVAVRGRRVVTEVD